MATCGRSSAPLSKALCAVSSSFLVASRAALWLKYMFLKFIWIFVFSTTLVFHLCDSRSQSGSFLGKNPQTRSHPRFLGVLFQSLSPHQASGCGSFQTFSSQPEWLLLQDVSDSCLKQVFRSHHSLSQHPFSLQHHL